jgi:hypothetical protein
VTRAGYYTKSLPLVHHTLKKKRLIMAFVAICAIRGAVWEVWTVLEYNVCPNCYKALKTHVDSVVCIPCNLKWRMTWKDGKAHFEEVKKRV